MRKLRKGQLVVRVLSLGGVETASIVEVEKVTKGIAKIKGSSIEFDAQTRQQKTPDDFFECEQWVMGVSRLIDLDGGEEERWGLHSKGGVK